MTVALTKVQTQVTWRSPDAGDKLVSIPASAPDNKGYDLYISSTIANGDTYVVTPTSGTIDGQPDFTFTLPPDENCTLSLRSDAENSDWIIRCLCCVQAPPDAIYFDQLKHGYYTTSSAAGSSPYLSFSFWIAFGRLATASSIVNLSSDGVPSASGIAFQTGSGSNNTLRMTLLNSSATSGIAFNFNVPNDRAFHNVLGSINVSVDPCIADIYVDETHTNGSQSATPFNIDFSGGVALPDFPDSFAAGAFTLNRASTACVGDFWWAPGQYLDFRTSANRAIFHDLTTHAPTPISALGANGETPTGAAPFIFLTGGKATFGENRGSGGPVVLESPVENCLDGLRHTFSARTSRAGMTFYGSGKQMGGDIIAFHPNGPLMTYSVWLRFDSIPTAVNALLETTNTIFPSAYVFRITIETTRLVTAYFADATNVSNVTFSQTSNPIPADGDWHHLILSVNTQTGVMQVVVDRNYSIASISAGSAGFDIGYLRQRGWEVFGSLSAGSLTFLGDAGELWVDITTGFDLTDSSVLDLWEQSGLSVDLGTDGSIPLGGDRPTSYHSQRPRGYEAITFFDNRASDPVFIAEYPGTTMPPTIAPAPHP